MSRPHQKVEALLNALGYRFDNMKPLNKAELVGIIAGLLLICAALYWS